MLTCVQSDILLAQHVVFVSRSQGPTYHLLHAQPHEPTASCKLKGLTTMMQ